MAIRRITFDHSFLRTWIGFTQRAKGIVVIVAVVLTVAAGIYVAGHLEINTDTSDMLSHDLPFRQLTRELDTAFPQFADNIVVVIDAVIPELVDQAALRLADALRRQPDLFGSVYDLAGDPFFRRHGLLYMDLIDLEHLSDHLARAQPFLTTLYQDPSLRGLADVLVLALGKEGGGAGRTTAIPVLRQMATVVEAVAEEGRFVRLSWEQVMQGRDDAGTLRRILVIQPALDFTTLHPARQAMMALRALATDLDLTSIHGIRLRLTGSVALAEEELASVEGSIGLANVVSLILVTVLLIVGLRSLRLVIPVLLTLAMGLTWTAALALLIVGSLNLISVAFAVLFIGLGVDFGIHFSLRYQEGVAYYPEEAMAWAAQGVGGSLSLSAMGAALGFFSFLPTPYRGFAELGLIAGIGMLIALIANLSVLPALLGLMPLPRVARSVVVSSPRLLARLVISWPRALTAMATVLAVGSMAILPAARFDLDPLNLKDPEAESVRTLRDLMHDKLYNPHSIVVLAESPAQAQALAERLTHLPSVAAATTLFDYIPQEQTEKLQVISDIALLLSPLFAAERLLPPTPAEVQYALAALVRTLTATPDKEARRLQTALERLVNLDGPTTWPVLETALLATLPQCLETLRQGLQAGPITVTDLPSSLREREMITDGRTRITVRSRENLTDRESLRRFVETVQTLAPRATGAPIILYESGVAVMESFWFATTATVLVLLLLLVVFLRRLREVVLTFVPLVFAALLTNTITVMIDLPYNFANAIALPLLFGVGIANGIQFVVRERQEHDPRALLGTTTPRAVTLSALTTIASFGSLALSTHPGTASMGLLLCITMTVTLGVTIFVLPALMIVLPRWQGHLPLL